MLSQQQINENKFKLRVERFESIWNKTEGSDFDKTLAMLYVYCSLNNWGTHAYPVWGKIRNYYGYSYHRQTVKNPRALRYTLPYLLLRLSENISFSEIKPHGDLAAIFSVIKAHANINHQDFDQQTELCKVYARYKDDIKKVADDVESWKDLINNVALPSYYSKPKHDIKYRYIFIRELLKVNLIDYLASWDLIVGIENEGKGNFKGVNDYVALSQDISLFDEYCPIAEENIREYFNSNNIQRQIQLLQYLYCKMYKLPMQDYYGCYGSATENKIQKLCRISGEMPVDGVLLLDMVKKLDLKWNVKHESEFYTMYIDLFNKKHLIANWKEIDEILINSKCINFIDFMNRAIAQQSVSVINYLLNELKIKINLNTRCDYYFDNKSTVFQMFIQDAKSTAEPKYGYEGLTKFRDIVKMLIAYDPDCVRGKDAKGHNIFYYLDHAMMWLRNDWQKIDIKRLKEFESKHGIEVVKILDEVCTMIDRAYYYREQAFAFFSCFRNKEATAGSLPMDVVNLIKDHTMYSEITVRKN